MTITRIEALRELLAKVEVGDAGATTFLNSMDGDHAAHAYDAYNGSLDAAKALHEAVLPGWSWESRQSGFGHSDCYIWNPNKQPKPGDGFRGTAESAPARSWLIAILKALIVMEAAQ